MSEIETLRVMKRKMMKMCITVTVSNHVEYDASSKCMFMKNYPEPKVPFLNFTF